MRQKYSIGLCDEHMVNAYHSKDKCLGCESEAKDKRITALEKLCRVAYYQLAGDIGIMPTQPDVLKRNYRKAMETVRSYSTIEDDDIIFGKTLEEDQP